MEDGKIYSSLEECVYGLYDVLGVIECVEHQICNMTVQTCSFEDRALRCGISRMEQVITAVESVVDALQRHDY